MWAPAARSTCRSKSIIARHFTARTRTSGNKNLRPTSACHRSRPMRSPPRFEPQPHLFAVTSPTTTGPAIGTIFAILTFLNRRDLMDTYATSSDRFARQRDLVSSDRLAGQRVTVIGVGAIGRQVALQLAAIGVGRLQLVDFDRVDLTNLTTQGYWAEDIGSPKVTATAQAIARLDPKIKIEQVDDHYRPKLTVGDAIFCCVDSIEARAAIWRSVHQRAAFWADGRVLGEAIRILA